MWTSSKLTELAFVLTRKKKKKGVSFYSDDSCTVTKMVAAARPNETCVNFYSQPVNSYRVRDLRPFSAPGH